MRRLVLTAAAVVATFGIISPFAPAQAQATRTWVSGVGDDVNPCSRTAPCKTFAGAISKTAAGGEINCLDPGGYGAVTITKAITISCPYTYGSILASAVNGVVINAGVNDAITLRGLAINGAGTTLGLNGIRFLAGGKLIVDRVDIFNFSQNGIDINKTATGNVEVLNSSVSNVGGSGLAATTSAGFAIVQISNSHFFGMATGVSANSGSFVTVSNSTIAAGTSSTGAIANSGGTLNVDGSLITNNATGINSAGGGNVRASRNSLYGNTNGFVFGGNFITAGNNVVDGATQSPATTLPANK